MALGGCAGSQATEARARATFGDASLAAPAVIQSVLSTDNRSLSVLLQEAGVNLEGTMLSDTQTVDIVVPLTFASPGKVDIELQVRGDAITSRGSVVELWTLQPAPKLVRTWRNGQREAFFASTQVTLEMPASELVGATPAPTRTGRMSILLRAYRANENEAAMLEVDSIDATMR